MAKLIRTDKNGTKYYEETECPKCGGTGYIEAYKYIEGGMCFHCNGTGVRRYTYKIMTPEYKKKLEERRIKRAEKKAPERRQKFLTKNGFNKDGFTWVVKGNTFEIKEELKEAGAKFSPLLKWHFGSEPEFDSVKVHVLDLFNETLDKDGYVEKCEAYITAEKLLREESTSKYIGTIKEKLIINLTIDRIINFDGYYGVATVVLATDENKNQFKINTNPSTKFALSIEEKGIYTVKGTVKDHKDYKGIKQTILTRCGIIC